MKAQAEAVGDFRFDEALNSEVEDFAFANREGVNILRRGETGEHLDDLSGRCLESWQRRH